MAGGYPCCCGGCKIFSDNFNREPSTDLGPNWKESLERTGDAEIKVVSIRGINESVLSMEPDSEVILQKSIKTPWVLTIKLPRVRDNDIYVVATTGGDVTLEAHTGLGTYSLLHLNGLTVDFFLEEDASINLHICRGPNFIFATTADDAGIENMGVWTGADPVTDEHISLVNPIEDPNTILWDDFNLQKQYAADHKCPDCACTCDGYGLGENLLATITNVRLCSTIDGMSFPLVHGTGEYITSAYYWYTPDGQRIKCAPWGDWTTEIQAELICSGPERWQLTLKCAEGYETYLGQIIAIQCNPLSITFRFYPDYGGVPQDPLCYCCHIDYEDTAPAIFDLVLTDNS